MGRQRSKTRRRRTYDFHDKPQDVPGRCRAGAGDDAPGTGRRCPAARRLFDVPDRAVRQAAPSQVNAYELWKDQVNAAGGLDIGGGQRRPVEFVSYDDQSNPANAVRIYEKLITQDKVDLLAAPWSTPIHLALAPVLARSSRWSATPPLP